MRVWLLLASLALSGAPPPSDPPADCGQDQLDLPAFSLQDMNPSSGSFGQDVGLSDAQGQVRVVYWASATCGVCKSHVTALQAITTQQGWDDVQVLVVNLPPYVEYIDDLTSLTDLPVLQDTDDADVATAYGAAKWYVYFVDKQGQLDHLYYELDLAGDDAERFVDEVNALREAK
jgi:hypothetical protein